MDVELRKRGRERREEEVRASHHRQTGDEHRVVESARVPRAGVDEIRGEQRDQRSRHLEGDVQEALR